MESSPVSKKHLRPPFILAVAADGQGCGWHRCALPLSSVVKPGLADGRLEQRIWDPDTARAAGIDTYVFQRQVETSQLEAMRALRKACPDAFFVYELDDNLGAVPEKSFHRGFLPGDLENRVREGLAICDAATVSTEPMAEWMRSIAPDGFDVRIAPNAVPLESLRDRDPTPAGTRLRVGFGGGISHAGDLALLGDAMASIGDAVQWVFLGMQPDEATRAGVRVEFHPGVPPHLYTERLREMNLDLVVAPLEDNAFNRCKSNLRLLEAGAVGACVVAQDIYPYRTDGPPVFDYAETPADWTAAIRSFMATPASERGRQARALTAWVARHYTLEHRLKDRLAAWTRTDPAVPVWRPSTAKDGGGKTVVAIPGGGFGTAVPAACRASKAFDSLETACAYSLDHGADVLWLRPGTSLTEHGFSRIRAVLGQPLNGRPAAAAMPLGPDGINAFPRVNQFTPTAPDMGADLDGLFRQAVPEQYRVLDVAIAGGPAVMLDHRAIAMLGCPDPAGFGGDEEAALTEWSLRAQAKGWAVAQVADAYASCANPPPRNEANSPAARRLAARGYSMLAARPTQALPDPIRQAVEISFVAERWSGPVPGAMGFPPTYESWDALREKTPVPDKAEVCIAAMPFGADPDGDELYPWRVYVDDSVHLRPDALQRLAHACAAAGDHVAVVYADHDTTVETPQGRTSAPVFKTGFDAVRFEAQDYVTQVCAVRISAVSTVPKDRIDLYSMLFRLPPEAFVHLPEVLATVDSPTPEELGVSARLRRAVLEDFYGDRAKVEPHGKMLGCLSVVHAVPAEPPRVSIIVPTKGDGWMLQPCLGTLLRLTKYRDFEVVVVHNGVSEKPDMGEYADDPRIRWYADHRPFNWAEINNEAVRAHTRGEFLCFVNDDVRVAAPDWLDAMVGRACAADDIGAVGARLLYPQGLVQHVGVVVHRGVNGHLHKGLPADQSGMNGIALLSHENTAVTGAVMLVSRKLFNRVGGFDERWAHNYNDVNFCIKLRRIGLRNVVEAFAELIHMEGVTRVSPLSAEGLAHWRREAALLAPFQEGADPYWSPNLALAAQAGGLFVQGLGGEMLAWTESKPPGDVPRILLVNDFPGKAGLALHVKETGGIPMGADMSGFGFRFGAPMLFNSQGWDIRDPSALGDVLRRLGVSRIVLRSLVGAGGPAAPVEALRCLAEIGIPVDCALVDAQAVCPRRDMAIPGSDGPVPCGEGWKKGLDYCQACVNAYGTPFGRVDVPSWWAAWQPLMFAEVETPVVVEDAS